MSRSGMVCGLAGVVAATIVWIVVPRPADASHARAGAEAKGGEDVEPLKEIHTTQILGVLSSDEPLRLSVRGTFPEPAAGSTVKFFFASHDHYEGELRPDAVEEVIDAGRAESLEHRLGPAASERLEASLAEFDLALRDMSLLLDEIESEARTALRNRPDRSVVIRTKPREADPAYPDLLRLRPSHEDGTTWNEPHDDGERFLFVLWREWPELRQLYSDRSHMLVDRELRVRRWIDEEYRKHGMKVFHEK